MKCPLCEKEFSRQSSFVLNDETVCICRECIRKAEDDIFFDNMDRLHYMTENLTYFKHPFFRLYDRMQKLFLNNFVNWCFMYSKT